MKNIKRSSSIRSAADIVGGNEDLLKEILLFLPATSLVRFKLVSKQWRYLISSRSFYRLLRCRRPATQHSFILRDKKSFKFFICNPTVKELVPFSFPFGYVKILQSCNGLLLLQTHSRPNGSPTDYYVCNPTTKRCRNLFLNRAFLGLCLIFDPSKSPHYKVVSFRTNGSDKSFYVYNSRTHQWSECGKTTGGPYKFNHGVYFNGRIYFISVSMPLYCYSRAGKIYRVCDIPKTRKSGLKKNHIMESNGNLHYLGLSLKPDQNLLYVYELKKERHVDFGGDLNPISPAFAGRSMKERFVGFCGNLNPFSASFAGSCMEEIELLGMVRGERRGDFVLVYHVPGKIMIYRSVDQVCEELVRLRDENRGGRLQFEFRNAYNFIESLAHV